MLHVRIITRILFIGVICQLVRPVLNHISFPFSIPDKNLKIVVIILQTFGSVC